MNILFLLASIIAGFNSLFMHWYSAFFLFILTIWLLIHYFIKNDKIKKVGLWGIILSQFLLWISLGFADFLGYKGGFPIKTFEYPLCHPCGGDVPPIDTLPMFITNFVIWFIISCLISFFLPKKILESKKYFKIITILSFLVMMSGLGRLLLIFD